MVPVLQKENPFSLRICELSGSDFNRIDVCNSSQCKGRDQIRNLTKGKGGPSQFLEQRFGIPTAHQLKKIGQHLQQERQGQSVDLAPASSSSGVPGHLGNQETLEPELLQSGGRVLIGENAGPQEKSCSLPFLFKIHT